MVHMVCFFCSIPLVQGRPQSLTLQSIIPPFIKNFNDRIAAENPTAPIIV